MARGDKKRANGLGTVVARGDKSRWSVTLGYVTVVDPVTGATRVKRQSASGTCDTETEAYRALARAIADHHRGLIAPSSDLTLAQYTETWLARQTTLQPSSLEAYRWELSFALKVLGSRKVKDIKPAALKDYVSTLARATVTTGGANPKDTGKARATKPMSPRTQSKIVTRLRSVFAEAVSDQLIYTNPMDAVRRSRGQSLEAVGRVYDFPEAARAREVGAALTEMELLRGWIGVLLGLSLGMRRGEIMGLQWSDVDLSGGSLRVQRGLKSLTERGPVFGPPKTKSSRREIGIPKSLGLLLKAHRERQDVEQRAAGRAWLGTGAVVATELGNHTHPKNLRRTLETARFWSNCANLEPPADQGDERWVSPIVGIPHRLRDRVETLAHAGIPLPMIRVHDLRHTYATLALRSKVPVEVVSKTLGHTRISITMDTYRHVLESEMRGNAFDLLALTG